MAGADQTTLKILIMFIHIVRELWRRANARVLFGWLPTPPLEHTLAQTETYPMGGQACVQVM